MKETRYMIFNMDCTQDGTWFCEVPHNIKTYSLDELKESLLEEINGRLARERVQNNCILDAGTLYKKYSGKTVTKDEVLEDVKRLNSNISELNAVNLRDNILKIMYVSHPSTDTYTPENIRSSMYLDNSLLTSEKTIANLDDLKHCVENFYDFDSSWEPLCAMCRNRLAVHIAKVDIKED